jgi:hypothetical protein
MVILHSNLEQMFSLFKEAMFSIESWCQHHMMNDDKTHLVVTKSMAQVSINLVISRRLNANASPDMPKPLYQWGGCASPLIQSFGCTDSARALRRPTAHAPFGDTIHLG